MTDRLRRQCDAIRLPGGPGVGVQAQEQLEVSALESSGLQKGLAANQHAAARNRAKLIAVRQRPTAPQPRAQGFQGANSRRPTVVVGFGRRATHGYGPLGIFQHGPHQLQKGVGLKFGMRLDDSNERRARHIHGRIEGVAFPAPFLAHHHQPARIPRLINATHPSGREPGLSNARTGFEAVLVLPNLDVGLAQAIEHQHRFEFSVMHVEQAPHELARRRRRVPHHGNQGEGRDQGRL
jgi:hypothetical protein